MYEEFDRWITMQEYCKVTGEKPNNVHARVRGFGTWKRGVHLSTPDGGVTWINLAAVLRWLSYTSKEG